MRAQRIGRALRLWVPAGILIVMLALCFLWPLVYKLPSATNGSILDAQEPPFSPGHWLGTDAVGNDIFSQLVYGGRVAFEVSVATTVIGMVIGMALGVTAWLRRRLDGRGDLPGARRPDRVPCPYPGAGHRRRARAE